MPDLPVMLRIEGKRCVIVGGGPVARRRAGALLDAGGVVTVIAPRIDDTILAMPVRAEGRPYRAGDLDGAFLVVVATDDPALNDRIAQDARRVGALVNRTDEASQGDVQIPAHARQGPITLAVHTGGISAAAAAAIRRELSDALDPDWPRLLELVAPYREWIQAVTVDADQRREMLRALTGPDVMEALKREGPAAVVKMWDALLDGAVPSPPATPAPAPGRQRR